MNLASGYERDYVHVRTLSCTDETQVLASKHFDPFSFDGNKDRTTAASALVHQSDISGGTNAVPYRTSIERRPLFGFRQLAEPGKDSFGNSRQARRS